MELTLGQLGDRTDEGVWLFIHPNGGAYVTWTSEKDEEYREVLGIEADKPLPRIQVRRWMNPAQASFQRKAFGKYRRIGEIPESLEQRIQREAIAHTVLVGWERIATPKGGAQPYAPELGVEALKADPLFMDAVIAAAFEEQNFRDLATQEDADVLGKPSSGSSSGDPT
jgi:hypothetical protein